MGRELGVPTTMVVMHAPLQVWLQARACVL
jgi:hypothetical protein